MANILLNSESPEAFLLKSEAGQAWLLPALVLDVA